MINISRFVIAKAGCPHCLEAKKAINHLNRFLPYDKQISVVDNYLWEELGFMAHPFIAKMLDDETFTGYPYIYIDGGVIEPAPKELLLISIARKLSHDLLREVRVGSRTISPETN